MSSKEEEDQTFTFDDLYRDAGEYTFSEMQNLIKINGSYNEILIKTLNEMDVLKIAPPKEADTSFKMILKLEKKEKEILDKVFFFRCITMTKLFLGILGILLSNAIYRKWPDLVTYETGNWIGFFVILEYFFCLCLSGYSLTSKCLRMIMISNICIYFIGMVLSFVDINKVIFKGESIGLGLMCLIQIVLSLVMIRRGVRIKSEYQSQFETYQWKI